MPEVDGRPVFGDLPNGFFENYPSYGEVLERNRQLDRERSAAQFSVDIYTMAKTLRIKPIEVEQMRVNGELIAFEAGEDNERKLMFPTWQQESGYMIPGIKKLLSEFAGQQVELALWGYRPRSYDGVVPAMMLRHGMIGETLEAMREDFQTPTPFR